MSLLDHAGNVAVVQWGIVIGASLVAAGTDLRSRRIPNALTLPLITAGLLYALLYEGLGGLGGAFAACVLLAFPYLLLFVFGGGGAGDAKMMGGIGAWLGLEAGSVVLVAVILTGGLLGLLNLAIRRQLGAGLGRVCTAFCVIMVTLCGGQKAWAVLKANMEDESQPQDRRLTIPYGPAIFIGVCIGALVVHSWNG